MANFLASGIAFATEIRTNLYNIEIRNIGFAFARLLIYSISLALVVCGLYLMIVHEIWNIAHADAVENRVLMLQRIVGCPVNPYQTFKAAQRTPPPSSLSPIIPPAWPAGWCTVRDVNPYRISAILIIDYTFSESNI